MPPILSPTAAGGGGGASQADIDAAVAALVDSSPATLDTLNELAAALGDDANFATTVTNALAAKIAASTLNANTILYATTDDTPAALAVGASKLVGRKASGDIAALTPAEAGVPGTILALLAYAPGSETTYTTTDTTVADLDATNLAIAFTAPDSGNVIVRLSAMVEAAAANRCFWALREGSSTIATQFVWRAANSTPYARITAEIPITGLTPGSSHTYKWAAKSNTTDDVFTIGGTDNGPFIMEVVAAPL